MLPNRNIFSQMPLGRSQIQSLRGPEALARQIKGIKD
jgi:hypothetical protein